MLLFKVNPSTQSTLNQVRGIQETNCLTEHASPNLDLPSTLPTISPLLTHCSKTSSNCDTCKKKVRTAIAHCRAKAEAKRRDTAGDSATSRDREVQDPLLCRPLLCSRDRLMYYNSNVLMWLYPISALADARHQSIWTCAQKWPLFRCASIS